MTGAVKVHQLPLTLRYASLLDGTTPTWRKHPTSNRKTSAGHVHVDILPLFVFSLGLSSVVNSHCNQSLFLGGLWFHWCSLWTSLWNPWAYVKFCIICGLLEWNWTFSVDEGQWGVYQMSLLSPTGSPQGCVLSPLSFVSYTNDCLSRFPWHHLLKFADDSVILPHQWWPRSRPVVKDFTQWILLYKINSWKTKVTDFRRDNSHIVCYLWWTCRGWEQSQIPAENYFNKLYSILRPTQTKVSF